MRKPRRDEQEVNSDANGIARAWTLFKHEVFVEDQMKIAMDLAASLRVALACDLPGALTATTSLSIQEVGAIRPIGPSPLNPEAV